MPLSSQEIMAMNGGWQAASMQQMAYGQSIGQSPSVYGSGYAPGQRGDMAMAGAMNRASAVGGPLAMGAASLAGLDPMSAGLTAAWSARGLGMVGAGAMGMGVGLGAYAAGSAAVYGASQMMEGARGQSQLNDTLRSSYNFRNSQGGSGFNRGEMSQIGTQLRDMSSNFGPGGEITGFHELTQLAGRMNSMGLAQGVKDVKDFSAKFKEMVTSLKHMATDLGTTLEGAMEFAAAAKQSGVFGMGKAAGFATTARQTAVSGGLAVSEVTAAASIGSQISRSIGGLGSQGANAGMRTIGHIGTAVKMGVLSEEDIYNVTGLTGAEGRQAYATSQMQKTASFLQSGKGRRMIASMAGKDGTLDETAVQEFLAGGMSIKETMRLDNKMKSEVGRANFIRNEGRLRGAVMERFGGNSQVLQMMTWAQSKGVDINNMDDRSMLFAQRQLGMGRDDMDQAIKEANAMPRIMEEERRSARNDQQQQQFAMMEKGKGVSGVQQRFAQAKEEINNKLQRVGQGVFNTGSELVEGFFNKLMDHYVETYSKDIEDKYQDMLGGGAIGKDALTKVFGTGFARGGGRPLGTSGPGLAARMSQGTQGGAMDSLWTTLTGNANDIRTKGGFAKWLVQGQSGTAQMKEAGFDMSDMGDDAYQAKLSDISRVQSIVMQATAQGGAAGSDANSSWVREAYSMGRVKGGGDERIASFGEELKRNDRATYDSKFKGKSAADQARLMAQMEGRAFGSGGAGAGGLLANYATPEKLAGTIAGLHSKGYTDSTSENLDYAKALGFGKDSLSGRLGAVGGVLGVAVGAAGLGSILGNAAGNLLARSNVKDQASGEYIKGTEFRDLATDLFGDDQDVAKKARERITEMTGRLSDEDKAGPIARVQKLMAASYDFAQKGPMTKTQQEEWAKKQGLSLDDVKGMADQAHGIIDAGRRRDITHAAGLYAKQGSEELGKAARMGIYDAEKGTLSAGKDSELWQISADAERLGKSILKQSSLAAGMVANDASAADNLSRMQQIEAQGDNQRELLMGMTVAQRRSVDRALGGGTVAGRSAAMEDRLRVGQARGGIGKTLANVLGADVTKEDLAGLKFDTAEHADAAAEFLASRASIKDDTQIKEIHKAVQAARQKGGLSEESETIRGIVESSGFSNAKKDQAAAADEEKNPTQAAIKKAAEATNKYLEILVKHTAGTEAELREISKGMNGNAENHGNSATFSSTNDQSAKGSAR